VGPAPRCRTADIESLQGMAIKGVCKGGLEVESRFVGRWVGRQTREKGRDY